MGAGQPLFERISIRQLQTFALVYELGSLVKAAHRLSITQPAVTKRLRELETDLNVALFQRSGRGVTPTAFAHSLFDHATTVLSTLRAAEGAIDAIRDGEGGSTVIGVSPVATKLVARAVIELKKKRPKIHARLETGSYEKLMGWIDSGEIDFAVARFGGEKDEKRLARTTLAEEPLTVLARSGHPATKLESPVLADLTEYPWVLPTPNEVVRPEIDQVFRRAGLPIPERLVETTSISATRELIAHGDAVTISPCLIYLDDFETGTFAAIPVKLGINLRPIGITRLRAQAINPPAQLLISAIEGIASRLN